MPLANNVLHGLLRRGEGALVRGSSRTIRESFRSVDSPYWKLSLTDRDALHAHMKAAASVDAVALEWSRNGGDERPLDAVRLVDVDRLADFLGVSTQASKVAAARRLLERHAATNERVRALLDEWAHFKTPRGFDPSSAEDFVAAIRVLDSLREARADQIVRVLSVRLFDDSKRIEALGRHLDLLTAEALGAQARERAEVFAEIGLVKEPLPMLFAGHGALTLQSGDTTAITWPYVGLASNAICAYAGSPMWLLSIENLTTFHQVAEAIGPKGTGLVIYSGGMPSPSWRAAYRRVLERVEPSVPLYHWGDIDRGGFRIAATIRACMPVGRTLRPWRMDAAALEGAPLKPAPRAWADEMARFARKAGWEELAADMAAQTCEQEGLDITLPGPVIASCE